MHTIRSSVLPGFSMQKSWTLMWLAFILFSAFALYLHAETKNTNILSYKEAMALAKEGKNDEAVAAIKRIMQENPDSDNREAHIRLGLIYFRTQQYQDALDEFNTVIALKTDSLMAYYFTGLIYEKMALGKTDALESKELKRKSLSAWQNYLTYASPDRERPESHKNIGITVEESIKRAQKHVTLLNEELLDENK